MLSHFKSIILRDLNKLTEEINLYNEENTIWNVMPGTTNSAGNLALHLVGNLRHFIGHELGKSGYVRFRDVEFTIKNVSRDEINELINTCINEVSSAFDNAAPSILINDFPKEIGGVKHETGYALLHLTSHLSYHLGQINYHRRFYSAKA